GQGSPQYDLARDVGGHERRNDLAIDHLLHLGGRQVLTRHELGDNELRQPERRQLRIVGPLLRKRRAQPGHDGGPATLFEHDGLYRDLGSRRGKRTAKRRPTLGPSADGGRWNDEPARGGRVKAWPGGP